MTMTTSRRWMVEKRVEKKNKIKTKTTEPLATQSAVSTVTVGSSVCHRRRRRRRHRCHRCRLQIQCVNYIIWYSKWKWSCRARCAHNETQRNIRRIAEQKCIIDTVCARAICVFIFLLLLLLPELLRPLLLVLIFSSCC